jgi:molybdopterin synthase sulfur carrier subunit
MIVRIRLFARARDLAGTDNLVLDLADGATVADLRRSLIVARPALASLAERSALAVDSEFATDSLILAADSEVALLPPVSGG